MSSSIEQAAALVLRAVDYGESDRVVTLFTREHGCISAIARAARKSKRRFAGALEGFALISVDVSFGRGALARLEVARVSTVFPRVLSDLSALDTAGALMRLTRELLPDRVPEPEVFDTLLQALHLLEAGAPAPWVRLVNEARVLTLTGYAPLLTECAGCGKQPRAAQLALFDATRGGIVCRSCGGGSERIAGAVRDGLQRAIEGEALSSLAQSLSDDVLRDASRLLALFITQVLQREDRPGRVGP